MEDDSPHGENAKVKNEKMHLHGVEWTWEKSKRLVSHLKIYDIGQHEAKLRWLLLREFGHHKTYPFSKGMWEEKTWQDTCIIWKGVWEYYDDVIFSPHGLYDGGMMRQQRNLVLWRIEREQGQNFSHIFHDVAMGGDGNIMRGVFDIVHVKKWIYKLAGAYFHRPTMLSLWSSNLLMECSQDHFMLNALGGHRGGEIDRVVDGLIGCYGMLSLTWMSKHKNEDSHGVCDSLLFRLIFHTTTQDSSMDLVTILLPSQVRTLLLHLLIFHHYICILLTCPDSALLYKGARFSLGSMVHLWPAIMMETTI